MKLKKWRGLFKRPSSNKRNQLDGQCPVCWGYQQYDHHFKTLHPDRQIDVINHSYKYMRIQRFLTNYIDGIRLKKGELQDCTSCG